MSETDRTADRVPPSNRKGTCPVFGHEAARVFGVDKVSVSFPVTFAAADSDWGRLSIRNGSEGAEVTRSDSVQVVEGVRAMIGVSDIPATGRQWAKVEVNPSRVLDPDGWSATAGAADTLAVVEAAISQAIAEGWFEPAIGCVEEARLRRLDVARDFEDVSQPAHLIGGLIGVHRNHARQARVFYDPERSGAQTLTVGGKRDQVRLYDKATETGGQAAGVVRWEALARDGWLKGYGDMSDAGDMTDDRIDQLGRDRFEWSGMGMRVVSSAQLVTEKVSALGLSPTKRRHVLGYLMEQAYGVPSGMSRTTAAEYRRIVREAGVVMALDGLDQAEGFTVHLDLEEGREVLSV